MKFTPLFLPVLLSVPEIVTAAPPIGAWDTLHCDTAQALSILEGLHSGERFCSSIIYPNGRPTKTRTTDVTVTAATCTTKTKTTEVTITEENCSTKTKTTKVTEIFTETVFTETDLPGITSFVYSSTVLVPTGTYPRINKRNPAPTIATSTTATVTTPHALESCSAHNIDSACSSLIHPSTVTALVTNTRSVPCTTTAIIPSTRTLSCTVTETDTSTHFVGITTITATITGTPGAAIQVSATGVLTTTVPAGCAGSFYTPFIGSSGDGNGVFFPQYPNLPIDGVQCCVFCFTQPNCIASFFAYSLDVCELLERYEGPVLGGANAQCPLGLVNYEFGAPEPSEGVLPGPCVL